jgi:hypothetical protein
LRPSDLPINLTVKDDRDFRSAVQRMREALLNFIEHNGIPRSKFHETGW